MNTLWRICSPFTIRLLWCPEVGRDRWNLRIVSLDALDFAKTPRRHTSGMSLEAIERLSQFLESVDVFMKRFTVWMHCWWCKITSWINCGNFCSSIIKILNYALRRRYAINPKETIMWPLPPACQSKRYRNSIMLYFFSKSVFRSIWKRQSKYSNSDNLRTVLYQAVNLFSAFVLWAFCYCFQSSMCR